MPKVTLRFYEELNERLPPEKHRKDFEFAFCGRSTVGEMIEGHGISEQEVDLVLVNGHSAALDHVLQDGDRVSVYPVFERFDVSGVTRLRTKPLRDLKFVAEKSLSKTAERMKALGFDVSCADVEEAMEISERRKRILLTSEADIARSSGLSRVMHVAPAVVEDQIRQILRDLYLL